MVNWLNKVLEVVKGEDLQPGIGFESCCRILNGLKKDLLDFFKERFQKICFIPNDPFIVFIQLLFSILNVLPSIVKSLFKS